MAAELKAHTTQEINAAIQLARAVADTIREVGEAPSGPIYAALMTAGISYETYVACVEMLKRAKLVSESNRVLKWIGPK